MVNGDYKIASVTNNQVTVNNVNTGKVMVLPFVTSLADIPTTIKTVKYSGGK